MGDGACLQAVLDHGEAMERGVGRVHSHAGGTLKRRHVSCGFAGRGIFFREWSAESGECFCTLEEHQQPHHVSYTLANRFFFCFSEGMERGVRRVL